MPTRITGLTSGLDTEALVSAMVMGHKSKVTKNQQSQTKLQYKMDALKNINTDVYNLFSSVDKMRWSSAYSLKATTVSDATKAKVTATDTAVNGTQTLKITKLAQAGYLTGGNVKSDKGLSTSTKLSDIYTTSGGVKNEFAGGSITVTVGGKEKTINLTNDMSANDLANQLKDAGLNANFDANNGRFFISSKSSGADNDFKLVANDANGLSSLKSLGLYSADADSKAEYKKWADYGNKSADEWDAFVNEQYASKVITAASRASSYASQYNSAQSALSAARKNAAAIFDSYSDDDKTVLTSASAVQGRADSLIEKRDKDSKYDAFRTEVEDKDAEGNVIGKHYEYNLEEMKAAAEDPDNTFSEADLEEFNKLQADIDKYSSDAKKLTDYEKTITEQTEKIDSLKDKVNIETDDQGEFVKATALTDSDGSRWDAITTEVEADNAAAKADLDAALRKRVSQSAAMYSSMTEGDMSEGASRIKGSDATIFLNGAEFTSTTNSFSINGLSIEATALTDGVTITTATDTQGLYDKIKDFIQGYNDVINKINKLYNAPSAKGYDPLTEEQKESMSETEISKWESKIKDSILRRDDSLSSIIQAMTGSMSKVFEVNGKNYSLATFGVKTLGYFSSSTNENYAFHIDGDADDSVVSGNSDKLMAAIMSDPDSVVSFFQKLSSSLYDSLNAKMKSTSLSSAYTIYNDKQMASEYSDYTSTIAKWQDKVADMEDRYFKKFSAMEATLSKIQNQTSSLSSYFGG